MMTAGALRVISFSVEWQLKVAQCQTLCFRRLLHISDDSNSENGRINEIPRHEDVEMEIERTIGNCQVINI